MTKDLEKIMHGYQLFREKYASGDRTIMQHLSDNGQSPKIMVIACCDSRVDPALILQCEPGDLFVVRNVANIVPPYEKDASHHGTSAALEFAICFLNIERIIILGHSQCGGIQALVAQAGEKSSFASDFIGNWVSIIESNKCNLDSVDECAKSALHQSHENCMQFPWIAKKVKERALSIHLWFFDIKTGQIFSFSEKEQKYLPLDPVK